MAAREGGGKGGLRKEREMIPALFRKVTAASHLSEREEGKSWKEEEGVERNIEGGGQQQRQVQYKTIELYAGKKHSQAKMTSQGEWNNSLKSFKKKQFLQNWIIFLFPF